LICRLLFVVPLLAVLARAEEEDGGVVSTNDDGDMAWVQAFFDLCPYLVAIFFVVFSLHVYLYPKHAERTLLREEYINTGARMSGQALSCDYREGSGGDAFLADVVYKAREHKYIDNPSMKFRNPAAYEEKSFLRRFKFGREVGRGEELEMLIPDPERSVRSGIPTEVVEQMLAKDAAAAGKYRIVLALGGSVTVALVALAIREVVWMDDPGAGWAALIVSLAIIEVASFLYSADQYFKSKRRKFDSARPTIASAEQEARERAREAAVGRKMPEVPFRIAHEFSGHARASLRQS